MAMQKSMRLALMAAFAVVVVAAALVSAAIVATRTVTSTGSIYAVGVQVFSDSACTIPASSVNWGAVTPGSVASVTLYLKNNGTVPVTLTVSYGTWSPASASSYMTPGWNCTNYALGSGSVVTAALTLTVLASVTGITTFSFAITITGTG